MEERIELKDPEHPEAKAAAEATARLLIEVHRKRQELVQMEGDLESASGREVGPVNVDEMARTHAG